MTEEMLTGRIDEELSKGEADEGSDERANEEPDNGADRRMLPLSIDLSRKLVVIFGGGSVGERKARLFSQYARVKVVSKDFTPCLVQMASEGDLELIGEDVFQDYEKHLSGAFIAVPATSNGDLNAAIEKRAQEMGVLVNRVDGPGEVVIPSLIRKGPITVAITTESPALSKYLRQRLEGELTENYREMAVLLGQIRRELKRSVPTQKARSRIIWEILEDEEVWRLLTFSYEKAYMRARSHAPSDERDSLDACDPSQGLDRRD
ncbi:MAG: bifunctional precorrin-2 dehydrogenase/sirohydrochlorin ferrochelatase [Methanotrichaceae archaeon]|nr:bifunctional precorrin-2 dehydrogenase/sirohydrochlorin ferrochelatase [Methanotrichaceae archaeon]